MASSSQSHAEPLPGCSRPAPDRAPSAWAELPRSGRSQHSPSVYLCSHWTLLPSSPDPATASHSGATAQAEVLPKMPSHSFCKLLKCRIPQAGSWEVLCASPVLL